MRDVKAQDTIFIGFTTRAFATGIPTVLAGSPVVSAYEDASTTQITAGITLTISLDGVVGLNMLTIVATSANGYDTGKDYNMVITTGTVGGVSVVGEVVGQFTIDRAPAAQDLANVTDGLGALKALIDTIDGIVDTILIDTDLIDDGTSGLAKIATDAAAILADTAVIGTLGVGLSNIPWNASWDAEVQSEVNDALVALKLDHLIAVADDDAPVNNSIIAHMVSGTQDWSTFVPSTDSLEALQADTADIQSRLPAALASGNMKSDMLAINGVTAAAANLAISAGPAGIIIGAAEAGTLSTTQMTSNLGEATNTHWKDRQVLWTSGVLLGQMKGITAYLGSTGRLTYNETTEAPSAADTFIII